MRIIGNQDRKKVAAALRPVYAAPTTDASQDVLEGLEVSGLGRLGKVHPVPGVPAGERASLDGKMRENRSKSVDKLIEGNHPRMERSPGHPRPELPRPSRILPEPI